MVWKQESCGAIKGKSLFNGAYGMDWLEEKCERIFGAKRVIFVGGMESAAEQSIKLFKNFLKKNSKDLF